MKKEVSKKKKTNKELTKQDKALVATFVGLIALVLILGIVALNLDNIYKDESSDLVVPVLEEHAESELSVEVSDLTEGQTKEYILVVTNYKDSTVLEDTITYDLDITPTENTTIKVYKNNSSDNLLTEDDLLIENNKFKANKKTEDTYKIVIEATSTPKDNEKITIKIKS